MAIIFDEKDRTFSLHTENSSYQMMIDRHDFLIHLYYGPGINGSAEYLIQYTDRGFSGNPSCAANDRTYSMDVLPQEMPVWGNGDFRSPSLIIEKADGTRDAEFRYSSHKIKKGKYTLPGLPAVYGDIAETLEIILTDELLGLELILMYGVIPGIDVICRAAQIINHSDETLYIDKIHSATVDMINGDHDLITFCGRHMMERRPLRSRITNVSQRICSRRGTSSHQYNPFMIIADPETTDAYGNCFSLGLVYSGGFLAEAEKDQFGMTRIQMGLSDEDLHYPVKPEAVFTAPEVIMAFSREGLDGLSKRFHECINEHIIRGYYKHRRRPVLVNSWEAEYFAISRTKLLKLAEEAGELGIEMLVIDDGWFLGRNDDNSSLGDWTADPDKLGGTLEELVRDIKNAGLKCGIWMEPEMVSEDSSLFREHPDWALITPGRTPVRCRNQLVLDLSRKVIRDYIYGNLKPVFCTFSKCFVQRNFLE